MVILITEVSDAHVETMDHDAPKILWELSNEQLSSIGEMSSWTQANCSTKEFMVTNRLGDLSDTWYSTK